MEETMPASVDRTRTVEELEGCRWGEPEFSSYVVLTCHAVRRKPLAALTNEELRVGIGQRISLPFLVPLAVERLKSDPLLAASLYEGDLLRSVLDAPSAFWSERPDLREEVADLARRAAACGADLSDTSWTRDRRDEV